MTIGCWVGFITISLIILLTGGLVFHEYCASIYSKVLTVIVCLILIAVTYGGFRFYMSTASGQRAILDEKSELQNGIQRTVTIYTANGEIMAQYKGKIDLEANDGGIVKFDYKGKRYVYYNCFVECISE